MGTDENKMLVRRQFDDIWNGANWASVDQLFARDYVNHDPYNPDQPTGPQGFRQRVEGYRSVLDNFDLRVEQQIAEGDMVETHWSLRGIHAGPLEGVDPTGKSVHVEGQLLSRIVDGKFVEEWVHWDTLGLLRQIGAAAWPDGLTEAGLARPWMAQHVLRSARLPARPGMTNTAACSLSKILGGSTASCSTWPAGVSDLGLDATFRGPAS